VLHEIDFLLKICDRFLACFTCEVTRFDACFKPNFVWLLVVIVIFMLVVFSLFRCWWQECLEWCLDEDRNLVRYVEVICCLRFDYKTFAYVVDQTQLNAMFDVLNQWFSTVT